MTVLQMTAEEYQKAFTEQQVVFATVAFNELNAHKCQNVLYLAIQEEGRNRFGLIAGLQATGRVHIPFSAPCSLLSAVRKDNKVYAYNEAVKALVEYCQTRGDVREVAITLPPNFYAETTISTFGNALVCNGFVLETLNLNHQFDLSNYSDKYIESIDIKARQKLKAALKAGLSFEKVSTEVEIAQAYKIIEENRKLKGYPLHMTCGDVIKTMEVVESEVFIVRDANLGGVASAIVFHVASRIAQVIYWGNCANTDELKPMNFLAYKVFEYYSGMGFAFVDIGISTENGIPNFGLCDFKQSIGCDASTKCSFKRRFVL